MTEPIKVDLESAQQCKAIDMIRFLFAFCLSSGDSKATPVCDDDLLKRAFERVKGIALRDDTTLDTKLSKL